MAALKRRNGSSPIDDENANEIQYWDEIFPRSATSPEMWNWTATHLKRAADLLFARCRSATQEQLQKVRYDATRDDRPQSGSRPVTRREFRVLVEMGLADISLMLLGLAVENLAKGILWSRRASATGIAGLAELDKKVDLNHHRLVDLVTSCELELSPDEHDALKVVNAYTTWRGRYPVPKAAKKLYPAKGKTGRMLHRGYAAGAPEYTTVERVLDRLHERMVKEAHEKGLPITPPIPRRSRRRTGGSPASR